ncbi:MAG: ATP-binding protein [Atopobiaceae bacterium]|nr:ATP-binding protein [Atopobiaceae bacterium]
MERMIYKQLDRWKTDANRKPLLMFGARQVGKTWAMTEYGSRNYARVIRYDLASDSAARRLFEKDLNARRIINDIELREGSRINPEETLIIFDEVQEEPRAITALKYFCEEAREYNVMAAGSYLGITHHEGSSFPVGKVNTMTLRPMSFGEFLRALGDELLADEIEAGNLSYIQGIAVEQCVERLREYFVVGGMPEAVAAFVSSNDYGQVRNIQRAILSAYDGDFSKHAPLRILERMRLVWNSIPSQLARENRKFVFGATRPGARAKDFEESIQWLRDYGVINKIARANVLRAPLKAYEDLKTFKLFALDVGLLSAMSELEPQIVLQQSAVFTEFKGALTEQYVMQELIAAGYNPMYWSSSRSTAEVDVAVTCGTRVVPIEVKASENLRSKSLRVACEKFNLDFAVRTSLSDYRDDGWLVNIPLWGISQLSRVLEHKASQV